jgi:hypothetical protein
MEMDPPTKRQRKARSPILALTLHKTDDICQPPRQVPVLEHILYMAFGLSTGARIPFLMSCKALYNDPAFWGPNLVVTPGRPLPENWLSKRPGIKRVSIPFVWGSPGRVEATDLAFLRNSSYGEVEELRIEAISKDEAKWRWCALIKRAPPHANLPITFYRAAVSYTHLTLPTM